VLPGSYWRLEVLMDFKSRKAIILKFVLPAILLVPFALPSIPAEIRAGIIALVILFTGTFGAAVGLVRIRENRMVERLAVLPVNPALIVSDYILANAFLDGIQLLIPLIVITGIGVPNFPGILWVCLCFVVSLVAANAIGVIIGIMAASSGEVHLFAALTVLGIAITSGIPMAIPGPINVIGLLFPFRYLSDALLYAWGLTISRSLLAISFNSAIIIYVIALLLATRFFKMK
jgi:ABC-type multidrug transport system permease subunit